MNAAPSKPLFQIVCLFLAVTAATRAIAQDAESRFTTIQFPDGVDIDLPSAWLLIGEEWNNSLLTVAEAKLVLAKIKVDALPVKTLVALRSLPAETYGMIRLDYCKSTGEADIPISESKLTEFDQKMRTSMGSVIEPQKILMWEATRNVKAGNCPAIFIHYLRTGPVAPVLVWQYQILLPNRDVLHINAAARCTELDFWEPVIQKSIQSLRVRSVQGK